MCIALAIAGAAVAGLAGAAISGSAATSAADTQAAAAENAQNISLGEFNTITGQEQPFMQGGYGALGALEYGLGIGGPPPAMTNGVPTPYNSYSGNQGSYAPVPYGSNPSTGGWTMGGAGQMTPLMANAPGQSPGTPANGTGLGYGSLLQPFTTANWKQLSPAYGFQLEQGKQGVLNGDTAGAGALSGAAQKDLMSFNQNLANTSFNNAFNMYQTQQGNIYTRLAGLAQLGQSAASNTGQQGTALAGQAAQSAQNIGTAQAAGQIGSANAWSGALSSMSYLPWLYAGAGGGGSGGLAGTTAGSAYDGSWM